jgi:hypothetical protein
MEQEHLHDPLRFQYESNIRRYSIRTKLIAVFLVLIFIAIPLYEISPETFKLNQIIEYVSCPWYITCGCFG